MEKEVKSKCQTNGICTYYELEGQGDVLLFIHGLGSDSSDWNLQKKFFKNYFRVLTYDVRGHGKSYKSPGPYSVPLFANDLYALIQDLKIKKLHVCGISMGGWIAIQFTLNHPECVKTLCMVNSSTELVGKNFDLRFKIWQRSVLFKFLSMERIGKILAPKLFIKTFQKSLRSKFIDKWAKNHKPSYLAAFQGAIGWTVTEKISTIDCPVHIIAGDQDYTSVEEKKKTLSNLKNGTMEVIWDSRHATPIEHPYQFNEALHAFLKKNSP